MVLVYQYAVILLCVEESVHSAILGEEMPLLSLFHHPAL